MCSGLAHRQWCFQAGLPVDGDECRVHGAGLEFGKKKPGARIKRSFDGDYEWL